MIHLEEQETKKSSLTRRRTSEVSLALEEYSLQKLFPDNLPKELQVAVEEEKAELSAHINAEFLPANQAKTLLPNINLKDKLEMFKYQEIKKLGNVKLDANFTDRLTFIKIVNEHKLILFSLKEGKILVYDRESERGIVENFGEEVTCLDYDAYTDIFVLGHRFGKFGFAKWEKGRLARLERQPFEGYSSETLKKIKLVCGTEVIAFLTTNNMAELLVRMPGAKTKYKIYHLMDNKKKNDEYFDICALKLKMRVQEAGKIVVRRVSIVLGLFSAKVANFISFDIIYEGSVFKDIDSRSLSVMANIERPDGFIKFLSDGQDTEPESPKGKSKDESLNLSNSNEEFHQGPLLQSRVSLNRVSNIKALNSRQETFVLLSNRQWTIESQPFVVIIWDNILEQHLISDEGKFILSFRTALPSTIIAAYLGAVEFLVALSSTMDVYLIPLDKLRHRLEFRSIFEQEGVFEMKSLFSKVSLKAPIVGTDTASKGLAVWSDEFLQYFQVFEWENYLENLERNSLYLEALTFLSGSSKGQALPLNGLLYPNGSVRNGSVEEKEEYSSFFAKFSEKTREVISVMIDSMGGSSGIQIIMEVCIDLLIKTKNFSLLHNEFMEYILEGHYKDEALAKVFFQQLANLLVNNRLIEQIDIEFFVRIFEFSKTKTGAEFLEKFLFFLINNFKLNNAVFNTLKVTAFNKKLSLFLFFVLLHDPLSKDNLDYLLYHTMELGTLLDEKDNSKEFKKSANRLFAYIFNVFSDQSFFALDSNLQNKISDIAAIQQVTKDWLCSAANDFLLDRFPAKTIFLLNLIYNFDPAIQSNPLQISLKQEETFFKFSDPEKSFDSKFNDFFLAIFNRKSASFHHTICLLHFYFANEKKTISAMFFNPYFSRLISYFPVKKETAAFYNLAYLEYLAVRVSVHNKQAISSDAKLLELLQSQSKNSVVAELSLLYIETKSKEFFTKLSSQEFFFSLMADVFQASSKGETELFISFLKENKDVLLKKGPESFQRLLQGLPAEYLLSFAGQFKEDPKLQLRLFQALDDRGESYEMREENAAYYLSLLCLYSPARVIAFLEKNASLDVNKKLEICQQNNHQRGQAFILFKTADYHNAMFIYTNILKGLWEKRAASEDARKEIEEILAEILGFHVEGPLYKSIILELSAVIAKLSGQFEYRRHVIRSLFSRLFSMDCTSLVQDIKLSPDYKLFVSDQILIRTLLNNFKNLTDLNEKIANLFIDTNAKNKKKVLKSKCEGISLVNQRCLYCGLFDKQSEITYIFHRCKNMSHMGCHPVVDHYVCKACSENNIGELIRNFNGGEQALARVFEERE